jgi:hypothetical protein
MRVLAVHRIDARGGTVDAVRYSRYKYGQTEAIGYFARELGEYAMNGLPMLAPEPPTITAPASRCVPIGADLLADGVLQHINRVRSSHQLQPAVRAKLHRHEIPPGDYGSEDLATRKALLSQERISSIPELFTNRHVLVVDDLWVTGTSADVTAAAVQRWRPASLTYLVIARVQPAFAELHPEVEFELNHVAVDGLPALADLLERGPVVVNQRLSKFVLSQPRDRLAGWLADRDARFVWRLYCAALAEGLGLMPRFRDNVRLLVDLADRRRLDERAASLGWTA